MHLLKQKWAYYNDFDEKKLAWVRELIKQGVITDGETDSRSIKEVHPDDLKGFRRVHVPRKPDPEKYCRSCGKMLSRKRFKKTLEDMTAFLKRKYCNRRCMAQAMVKPICKSVSHSRMKAHKTILIRCEICGLPAKHVHHRDENPHNNEPKNLQTLCVSCHSRCHSPNFTETGERRVNCQYCNKPSMKRGLCYLHLSRFKRFGHPLAKKRKIGLHWVLMLHDGDTWIPFPSKRGHGIEFPVSKATEMPLSQRKRKPSSKRTLPSEDKKAA